MYWGLIDVVRRRTSRACPVALCAGRPRAVRRIEQPGESGGCGGHG